MRATTAEHALRRVLAWLRWAGWELTPELQQAVLQALADSIAAQQGDLFGACLQALQQRGLLQRQGTSDTVCPPLVPPLQRGSIGYGEY
ncbi:hypothetical protein [Pseudomonas sp. MYb185]|uniref:hypothetical protein n=1 Tax=Pseudomonas sp. MYb185 TaxID=1848729 RepID=UPI000CFC7569|nr:hypothetical protein [Pseudomonas sp. MYb185]PRB77483.1 hypothetical protein CQ007_16220 [Pseudomonas sp. MYb185]